MTFDDAVNYLDNAFTDGELAAFIDINQIPRNTSGAARIKEWIANKLTNEWLEDEEPSMEDKYGE